MKRIIGALVAVFWTVPAVAGTLYVAEEATHTLAAYDDDTGAFLGTLVSPTGPVVALGIPYGMVTTDDGYLFSADAGGHEVMVFHDNQFLGTVAVPQSNLNIDPQGVVIGPDYNLYVTNYSGAIVDFTFGNGFGQPYTSSSLYSNVPGARAGVIIGPDGTLYISDSLNGSAIYKVPPGGGPATILANNYLAYPYGNSRGLAWLVPGSIMLVADAGWQGTGLVYSMDVNQLDDNGHAKLVPFITGLGGADYLAVLDDDEIILVAEFSAGRVTKYDYQGNLLGVLLNDPYHPGVLAYSESDFQVIPEPSTIPLMLSGIVGLLISKHKTRLSVI